MALTIAANPELRYAQCPVPSARNENFQIRAPASPYFSALRYRAPCRQTQGLARPGHKVGTEANSKICLEDTPPSALNNCQPRAMGDHGMDLFGLQTGSTHAHCTGGPT